jgi:hypothetical protein
MGSAQFCEIVKRISPESDQFPPSVKKGKKMDVPDGIIVHLTRQCGGDAHDCDVSITSESFEEEAEGFNPYSGACNNDPDCTAENAAVLKTDSVFCSAHGNKGDDIPRTRNNWLCYHFKETWIMPTRCAIRAVNI